jgi:site-specific DNA-methyltransferase (adenine-specific)
MNTVRSTVLSPRVALGDGLAGLRSLRPGSVGLVLSDLPSGETRAEFDRSPPFPEFWSAVWGALRDNGAAVLMASRLQFAAALVASQADAFRYDLIWHKSIAGGFLNARHRPLRAHEFVLVFSRSQSTYNPQMRQGLEPVHSNAGRGSSGENYGASGGDGAGRSRAGKTDRFPWSVLVFASLGTRDPRRRHPQQKPVDLMRWCIRSYSNPGDLVVDPYAGSGASGEAAEAEGRAFLGWDTDPRFGTKTA